MTNFASLYIQSNSRSTDRPVLCVDCDLQAQAALPQAMWSICHETQRIPFAVSTKSAVQVANTICANLLLLFCHAVCVFADDYESPDDCVGAISNMLTPSDWPADTTVQNRGCLLLLTTRPEHLTALSQIEQVERFHVFFDSLQIVCLDTELQDQAPKFEQVLKACLHGTCRRRERNYMLLSSRHLVQSFDHMVRQDLHKPADIIDSVLQQISLEEIQMIQQHIRRFISAGSKVFDLIQMSDLLASAMLLRCYPSGQHHVNLETMYARTIWPILTDCLASLVSATFVANLYSTMQAKLATMFAKLGPSNSAIRMRRRSMLRCKYPGRNMFSNATCLWCISRPPERVLSCGHAICEICLVTFHLTTTGVHRHHVDRCLVCGLNVDMILSVKPPTLQPTILSMDGGGVRGIATLVMMERLQHALDVPWPLWQFFDLVVGTSVGGIIALDLVTQNQSIETSIRRFMSWIPEIFPVRHPKSGGWIRILRDLVAWLIRDSMYDSGVLDKIMQEAFGRSKEFFDFTSQHQRGTKVGIMATEVAQSELRIFTNYNGRGRRLTDNGYQVLRPPFVEEEPLIHEVARATVAAPPYFCPKAFKGYKLIQDGGLRANNPTEQALWELPVIWPGHQEPSLVVSFGTGYHDASTNATQKMRRWTNLGFPRLLRSFLSSPCLHGQNGWKSLLNRVRSQSHDSYIRINVEFQHDEPSLNDSTRVPELIDLARACNIDFDLILPQIWASSFYFELSHSPVLSNGHYSCRGFIYSRFEDCTPILEGMRRRNHHARLVLDNIYLADLDDEANYCCRCGFFSQAVRFTVPNLAATISIGLLLSTRPAVHLSSFPNSIQWIMDRQIQHQAHRPWNQMVICHCKTPSKRRSSSTSGRTTKRRRLMA